MRKTLNIMYHDDGSLSEICAGDPGLSSMSHPSHWKEVICRSGRTYEGRWRWPSLMTLVASVFAPMSWARDAKVVLSKNHTDAFYITTDTGVPVVKVANGLHSRMYDPNDVEFQIQSDTYGKRYKLTGLSESPFEGYWQREYCRMV